jgi:spore coat protein CotH
MLVFLRLPVSAAHETGNTIFKMDTIHEIRLTFNQPAFWDTLVKTYRNYHDIDSLDKNKLLANVQIDGHKLDSIGVKLKGNYSFSIPTDKKPMKIDFNAWVKGRNYEGLRAINLSNEFPDPSLLRNTVAYKILRDAGAKAPRTAFARVFVNNQYKGLYTIIEQIDKSFLNDHFNEDGGELIKAVASSLFWIPNDTLNLKRNYEIKSKATPKTWSDLNELAQLINITPDEIFFDSMKSVFDFRSYLTVFAADIIFNNWDSYFFGQNYYLYRDSARNQYHYLPWDYNVSLNTNEGSDGDYVILPEIKESRIFKLPLPIKVVNTEPLKTMYLEEVCRIHGILASDSLEKFILRMHNMILPAVKSDPGKVMTTEQFEQSLQKNLNLSDMGFTGLLYFISYRSIEIARQLNQAGVYCPEPKN